MPNPNDVPFIWDMGAQFLKDRERAMVEMSSYTQNLGQAVQNFKDKNSLEFEKLNKQFAEAKRSTRALGAEPYSIFGSATEEGLSGGAESLIKLIGRAEGGQRKNWQAVPGMHGHHQASLNSVFDAISGMPPSAQVDVLKYLTDKGYHLGSRGDKFLWLTEGAHLGGRGWLGPYAHMPADGSRKPDTARFRLPTFADSIKPSEAVDLISPQLQQQLVINKQALLNPTEQQVRAAVSNQAQRLGIGQVFGLENLDTVKSNNKAFKESGFNATKLAKALQQYQWANRLGDASKLLGAVPVLGAAFDAGDTFAGTTQAVTGPTKGQKLAGALQALSGGAGLASLNPPVTPIAAPVSIASGLMAAAVQRREAINSTKTSVPQQLFPKAKAVSARTPTGVAKLTKPKPIPSLSHRIQNEIQYGVNTVTNALSRLNPFRKAD